MKNLKLVLGHQVYAVLLAEITVNGNKELLTYDLEDKKLELLDLTDDLNIVKAETLTNSPFASLLKKDIKKDLEDFELTNSYIFLHLYKQKQMPVKEAKIINSLESIS